MTSKAITHGSGDADADSRKRCTENVTQIASSCRDDIICGKGFKLEPTGGTAVWREELTLTMVLHSLRKNIADRGDWRKVLTSTSEKVKARYPSLSEEITKTVDTFLGKSPMQGFKTAIAYRWLKYLETNPPVHSCWYPDLAVDVAYRVFFLKGNKQTFINYLSNPARKNKLKSLNLPEHGKSSNESTAFPTKRKRAVRKQSKYAKESKATSRRRLGGSKAKRKGTATGTARPSDAAAASVSPSVMAENEHATPSVAAAFENTGLVRATSTSTQFDDGDFVEIGHWLPSGVFQVFSSGKIEGASIISNGQQLFGVRLSGTSVKGWFCEDFLRAVQLESVRSSGSDSPGLPSDDNDDDDNGDNGEGFGSPDNDHSYDDDLSPSEDNLDDFLDSDLANLDDLFDGLGDKLHQVFESESFAEMVKQSVAQMLSSKVVVEKTIILENMTEAKDQATIVAKAAEDNTEDGYGELAFDARIDASDTDHQPMDASTTQTKELVTRLQALPDTQTSSRTDVERLCEKLGAEVEQLEDENTVEPYEVMFNEENKHGQLSKPPDLRMTVDDERLLEKLVEKLEDLEDDNTVEPYEVMFNEKNKHGQLSKPPDLRQAGRVFGSIGKAMSFEVKAEYPDSVPEMCRHHQTDTQTTALTIPCLQAYPNSIPTKRIRKSSIRASHAVDPYPRPIPTIRSPNSGLRAPHAVDDRSKRITVFREQHPGVFKGINVTDVSMQEGRALVRTSTAASVEMTRGLCKGGWHVYCGSAVNRGSRTTRKGYLCRICYTSYLGKTSYNDIQENCPACFLRLYDLSNKYRAGRRSSVEDRGGGSTASAVASTLLTTHTGVKGGPYPRHTAAIRRIVQYLNLRFPDCLDVLCVYDNFSKHVFLRNGTLHPTGRRTIGIVEYVKNGQLKWGVLKRFLGFRYDGIQPIDSVECKHPETSSVSASATTTCEYFSSTWVPQPRAIIAALKLTGFDDPRINGVYVFAGYRPGKSGTARRSKRNQDCAYFQSTAGLRLFPDEFGIWHVCNDDRVLASSSNTRPVWNPGRTSLDGGWILRDAAGMDNVLLGRWRMLRPTVSEFRNKCLMSMCRPLSPEEEYALMGDNLRAINEMKTLHALGVAMGGERTFNCKLLQWNPMVGLKKRYKNDRMNTPQVRLATCDWKDAVLRVRVGDLVFVEKKHRARLRAAGSKILVLHPDGTFLCNGRMEVHRDHLVVRLLNSDIPHAHDFGRKSKHSEQKLILSAQDTAGKVNHLDWAIDEPKSECRSSNKRKACSAAPTKHGNAAKQKRTTTANFDKVNNTLLSLTEPGEDYSDEMLGDVIDSLENSELWNDRIRGEQ